MSAIEVGAFQLVEPIGRGRAGQVWRARHRLSGHPVAVKVVGEIDGEQGMPKGRLPDEIRAVAQLDHPGVVRVYDAGPIGRETLSAAGLEGEDGGFFLAMGLADGTLVDFWEHFDRWSGVQVLLEKVLAALAYAHAQGILHRDLKPENVLCRANEGGDVDPWISDFGLADLFDAHRSTEWERWGTPQFMAPERVEQRWRDQGPWTDLYSVGCLAYWLVSGHAPFEGMSAEKVLDAQCRQMPSPLPPRMPVPKTLGAWLRRLLAKSIDDRYRCAADALADLRGMINPDGGEHRTEEVEEEDTAQFITLDVQGSTNDGLKPPEEPRLPALDEGWRRRAPGVKPLPGVGHGLLQVRRLPLVGRESIRDRLWTALRGLIDEGTHAGVLIQGARGLGSTRLGQWLAKRAHEQAGLFVLATSHDHRDGEAQALSQLFGRALGLGGLAHHEVLERLQQMRQEGPLKGISRYDCHALAQSFANQPRGPAGHREVTSMVTVDQMLRAMRNALVALGKTRPIILLLDDIQWGGTTARWVELLLDEEVIPAGLLVLMTADTNAEASPEALHTVQVMINAGDVETLEVGPLGEEAQRILVRDHLGLAPSLAEDVVQQTAGSPQYAVELVAKWIDEDALVPTSEGYVLSESEPSRAPLLDTGRDILRHRLDKAVSHYESQGGDSAPLEMAAVLGRKFEYGEWSTICEESTCSDPEGMLHYFTGVDVLQRRSSGWAFSQREFRDRLVERAREDGRLADHHRRCARGLMHYHEGVHFRVAIRIANHFLGAEEYERAMEPLLVAAEYQCDTGRWDGLGWCVDQYERCLSALGAPADDLRRIDIWETLIRSHGRRGQWEEGMKLIDRARTLALESGSVGHWARVQYHQAWFLHHQGKLEQSLELCQEIEGPLKKLQARRHLAMAYYLWSINLSWLGGSSPETVNIAARALELFEALDDHRGRARCLLALGTDQTVLGQRERGLTQLHEAIDLYETLGDGYGVGVALANLGKLYRRMGEMKASERVLRRAMSTMEDVGVSDVGVVLNLACTLIDRDNIEEAHRRVLDLLAELKAAGRHGFLGLCHATLLPCQAAMENWEAFDRSMERCRDYLDGSPVVEMEVALTFERAARRARQQGQPDRAQQAWACALRQWELIGDDERVEELAHRLDQG